MDVGFTARPYQIARYCAFSERFNRAGAPKGEWRPWTGISHTYISGQRYCSLKNG